MTTAMSEKLLRVSEPRGAQRSTYYLSLPYRYIVPLLLSSAVLHWLVLQSSYYVRVISYDQWGSAGAMISTCGFSVVAMIILLHLGGLMLRTAPVLGPRRFKANCLWQGAAVPLLVPRATPRAMILTLP